MPSVAHDLTRAEWAHAYAADCGWYVFPIHWPFNNHCSCGVPTCARPAKHPYALHAQHGEKDATINLATIAHWWFLTPEANIAVATGPSQLLLVDVDPRHHGHRTIEQWIKAHGPFETAHARTGSGGEHFWFTQPPELRIPSRSIAPGVDVKGSTGYGLVPGSANLQGPYRWEGSAVPQPPPAWLLELVTAPARNPSSLPLAGPIEEGQRHATFLRLLGAIRRHGAELAELTALAQATNARCRVPYPGSELQRLVWSVFQYQPTELCSELDLVLSVHGTGLQDQNRAPPSTCTQYQALIPVHEPEPGHGPEPVHEPENGYQLQIVSTRYGTGGGKTMDIGQFLNSNYIKKEDLGDDPLRLTVANVDIATFKGRDGKPDETKVQLHFDGDKKLSLNKTNLTVLAKHLGKDTSTWIGKIVTLTYDETVMFAGRAVGGIRISVPKGKKPEPEAEPELKSDAPF